MKKKKITDIYYRYFISCYVFFLRNAFRQEREYMASIINDSHVETIYLCGVPLMRKYEYENNHMMFLFGIFPLLLTVDTGTKICVYLGKMEVLKIRKTGKLQISEPELLMDYVPRRKKHLYYDIGSLDASRDGAGVPRVAANLLAALIGKDCGDYVPVPVCSKNGHAGFYGAWGYVSNSFPRLKVTGQDTFIRFAPGDILLFPIPNLQEVEAQYHVLTFLREKGIRIFFIIHDIIVIHHPEFFSRPLHSEIRQWLYDISQFSGIVAVSRASEQDYLLWRKDHCSGSRDFYSSWFHLGADMGTAVSSRGLPEEYQKIISSLTQRITFLSVSTIEPRKGYVQSLAAFEILWKKGLEVNFVIVGKKGWKMDGFIDRLETHAERNHRLFWLSGISDECLDGIYAASTAVLMASEAEGFGLAVVEGARHEKPLILRDIAVFREIAGEHATYFTGTDPEALAVCLERWIAAYGRGEVPSSRGIRTLSWDESAQMLLSRLSAS